MISMRRMTEAATTRKVIGRIPQERSDYKPKPISRDAREIARLMLMEGDLSKPWPGNLSQAQGHAAQVVVDRQREVPQKVHSQQAPSGIVARQIPEEHG